MSSLLICSGDLYSGSSPRSMVPISSKSGFSGAVLGSSVKSVLFLKTFQTHIALRNLRLCK